MFFSQLIDLRKKDVVLNFLKTHARYNTMNSWNNAHSFAHNVKLYRLGLPSEVEATAGDILHSDDRTLMNGIDNIIYDFTHSQNGEYTIGFNGRSSGYLVLYNSKWESTGYKSWCTCCGQKNYKSVMPTLPDGPEKTILNELVRSSSSWMDTTYLGQQAVKALTISDEDKLSLVRKHKEAAKWITPGNRCGVCNNDTRVNYTVAPRQLSVSPGRSLGQDLEDMSFEELKSLAKVVQSFDRACDEIRDFLIATCREFEVVEQVIQVKKKVRVLREKERAHVAG